MKKLLIILLIFTFNFSHGFARDEVKWSNIHTTNFSENCFQFYSAIPKDSFNNNETFKYISEFQNPIIIQNNHFLPTSFYWINKSQYSYISDNLGNISALTDINDNTFLEIDTSQQKSIVLDFWEYISDTNLSIHIDFIAKYHSADYQISADGFDIYLQLSL